jgi:hypothetical protein
MAVHRRRGHPGLALFDLEPAHLLGRRGYRRAPEKGGKAGDNAQVVVLGLGGEPSHDHVLDHLLT